MQTIRDLQHELPPEQRGVVGAWLRGIAENIQLASRAWDSSMANPEYPDVLLPQWLLWIQATDVLQAAMSQDLDDSAPDAAEWRELRKVASEQYQAIVDARVERLPDESS